MKGCLGPERSSAEDFFLTEFANGIARIPNAKWQPLSGWEISLYLRLSDKSDLKPFLGWRFRESHWNTDWTTAFLCDTWIHLSFQVVVNEVGPSS